VDTTQHSANCSTVYIAVRATKSATRSIPKSLPNKYSNDWSQYSANFATVDNAINKSYKTSKLIPNNAAINKSK
jgi:hypothetical protein